MELRELAYGNSHNSLIFEHTFIVYQFCCCCFAFSTLSTQARIAWIIILYCIWVNTLHIFRSSDSLANIESIKYIKISSFLSGTPVTCIFKLFGSKCFHIRREFSTKLTPQDPECWKPEPLVLCWAMPEFECWNFVLKYWILVLKTRTLLLQRRYH